MTQLYILLALGAALAVLALAMLTIKALNAVVKLALVVAIIVGLGVVGIIAMQTITIPTLADVDIDTPTWGGANRATDPAPARRGISAATSITITLSLIVMTILTSTVAAIGIWWWWTQRQKREKLELIAMLYGETKPQLPKPQRRTYPPPSYILPQYQPEPEPQEIQR